MSFHRNNLTFYYSKFSLFDDSIKFCFMRYIIFQEKLQENLGEEWKKYASQMLFQEKNEKKFLNSHEIFHGSLEIWLRQRQEIQLSKEEKTSFDGLSDRFELFDNEFAKKFELFGKNEACYKAVLQGFFNTANQIWLDLLQNSNMQKVSKKEMKNKSKQLEKLSYLKNKWTNIKKLGSDSFVMKPLVLVTEKLKDYFQSKPLSQDQDPLLSENEKVFASFKANFEREASEDLKEKLNRLTLKDRLSTTEIEKLNEKRKLSPTLITKQIKLKRFSNIEEKNLLSNDFLGPTTKYIEKFMEGSKEKWQVARCFVTNMIELNYNRIFELESQICLTAQDIKNNIKIRLLQPAESFYNHLMKIWIIFKSSTYGNDISFNEYLEKVKDSMGTTWSEKYLGPTQMFFNTLIIEWNSLKDENINEEQNLMILIKKVREDMMKIWEENIINKIQNI